MSGGELAVLQAPTLDGLSLDPFTLLDDGCGVAEVGVGGRHVVEALVVSQVVVVLDEGLNLGLKVAGKEVVLQQDAVLEGLAATLDLALGLRMTPGAAHVAHLPGLDVFRQFASDAAVPHYRCPLWTRSNREVRSLRFPWAAMPAHSVEVDNYVRRRR